MIRSVAYATIQIIGGAFAIAFFMGISVVYLFLLTMISAEVGWQALPLGFLIPSAILWTALKIIPDDDAARSQQ